MNESFAVEIYRRFLRGETAQQLSAEFKIPVERIETRIRAAAVHLERQTKRAA